MRAIAICLAMLALCGPATSAPVNIQPGTVAGYMYLPKAVTGSGSSDTLPVKAENAACTATTAANTAINAAYTKILTCNGGTWKPISVGALQTVTAAAACTASATNNIGVDATFSKAYLCVAGTWQEYTSTAKGVQTVTEGSACTASATNNIAVSADFSKVLSCQSGTWKNAQGGTGYTALYSPLKNMQISCSTGTGTFYAKVDANGYPYTMVTFSDPATFGSCSSGWVAGTTARCQTWPTPPNGGSYATWTLGVTTMTGSSFDVWWWGDPDNRSCTATWPAT